MGGANTVQSKNKKKVLAHGAFKAVFSRYHSRSFFTSKTQPRGCQGWLSTKPVGQAHLGTGVGAEGWSQQGPESILQPESTVRARTRASAEQAPTFHLEDDTASLYSVDRLCSQRSTGVLQRTACTTRSHLQRHRQHACLCAR